MGMIYRLDETPVLAEVLDSGDAVTVSIYNKATGAVVPLDAAAATEIGSTGIYRYTVDMTTPPEYGKNTYVYVFTGALQKRYGEFNWNDDELAFDGKVTIDTVAGASGTKFPLGTPTAPVDNITDAKTIADRYNIKVYAIRGSVTLNAAHPNWEFHGLASAQVATVNVGGQNVNGSFFERITIAGAIGGSVPKSLTAVEFILDTVTGWDGIGTNGGIRVSLTLEAGPGATCQLDNVAALTFGGVTLDANGQNNVQWGGATGVIVIAGFTGGGLLQFAAEAALLTLDATNVGGVAILGGFTKLTNLSAMTIFLDETLNRAVIADVVWDEVLTGATHNIQNSAGKRLRQIQEELGYEGGAVYIDTVNGTPGTNPFENGTVGLPVDNLPDALTIAAAVGLRRFIVYPGSSLTLGADFDSYVIQGTQWTLALGGRSISGSYIEGANLSGIGTGATPPKLVRCSIGAATLPPCTMRMCDFSMGITVGSAGDFFFDQCFSAVAGVSTPYFDFAAAGANDVNFRHYSGGIEIRNMAAGDRMSLEGHGQYILAASCSGGVLAVRGAFDRTDLAGGAVTESIDARLSLSGIRAEIMTYVLEGNILGLTMEQSLNFVRKVARNDLRQTDGDTDNLVLLDDDGATPLFRWDSKNKNGGPISQPTAAPARRIPS